MPTDTDTIRPNSLEPGSSLAAVAKNLELLEETLIYRCLERVQVAFHPELYQGFAASSESVQNAQVPEATERVERGRERRERGAGKGFDLDLLLQQSLLGLRLQAHEAMDRDFGRYAVAEEFPFSPAIAEEALHSEQKASESSLHILQKMNALRELEPRAEVVANGRQRAGRGLEQTVAIDPQIDLPLPLSRLRQISQCRGILQYYVQFLGQYCPETGDRQYGSALEYDVILLQAISRRIHYGSIYVAEIKYREAESQLRPLIRDWQNSGIELASSRVIQQQILEKITRSEVEQRILQRVQDKAERIQLSAVPVGLVGAGHGLHRYYLEPEGLRNFYADCIIPLTKQGELAYLFRRV